MAGVPQVWRNEALRIALLLALIAVGVSASGILVRVDHLLFDVGQRLNWRPTPSPVLIVAIDEDSLDQLGRWPWPRERHARLLRLLCAARPAAIGLDIAFTEPGDDRHADRQLAEAVAECGNVVLPLVIEVTRSGGQLLESPPIRTLAAAAAGIGRIGVRLDEDGIARSVDLREGLGSATWPLLAEEVLRVARQLPAAAVPTAAAADAARQQAAAAPVEASHHLVRQELRRLSFAGPPGTLPRVPYASLLQGRLPPELFSGRIVLIGATATGLGDFVPTPVSANSQPMPGVEVLGNVILAMRDGQLIRDLPPLPALLLTALLATVPMLWLPRLMPLPGLLLSTAWLVGMGLACALLPVFCNWWLAPGGALLAGVFAFPVWGWRRLEAARRHLDQELRQLRAILPASRGGGAADEIGRLGFEQRIALVQTAQQTMQALAAERNETLAFISHDLRAPLASAVSQLEIAGGADARHLLPQLRRALGMAQSFLWLARAEALDARQMRPLDLAFLLQQAVDEMYALARQRELRLRREIPEDVVWVVADFEAIERSAINLLDNALRHAPAGSAVVIGLQRLAAGKLCFWVDNEGAAPSADQRERMFRRFSRGETVQNGAGAGLGLYFVRTVAERHGGAAGVDAAAGRIRFWVELPAAVDAAPEAGGLDV